VHTHPSTQPHPPLFVPLPRTYIYSAKPPCNLWCGGSLHRLKPLSCAPADRRLCSTELTLHAEQPVEELDERLTHMTDYDRCPTRRRAARAVHAYEVLLCRGSGRVGERAAGRAASELTMWVLLCREQERIKMDKLAALAKRAPPIHPHLTPARPPS
jgi:hypothetical protein